MSKQVITVKSDEENPPSVELIAESIIEVAEAFKKINSSKLNRRAVIVLLYDSMGGKVGKREIEMILDNAPKLAEFYTKKGKS